jgi:hypothetical protein
MTDVLGTLKRRFRPGTTESRPDAGAGIQARRHRVQGLAIVLATAGAVAVLLQGPSDEPAPPIEPVSLVRLTGVLTTVGGDSVGGATVSAGQVTTVSAPDGTFAIGDLAPVPVQLRVRAPGLATAEARVDPSRPVSLQLVPITGRGTVDVGTGGRLADRKGFALAVPANAFYRADGARVLGTVDVEWTIVNDQTAIGAAPMPLATARDPLESFGMVEVRFSQDGTPVAFAGTAELSWPLAAHAPFAEGESASLYSYDTEAGAWREDGQGTVARRRVHAQVGHFSWWSVDRPIAVRGCVAGRIDGPLRPTIVLRGEDYLANVTDWPTRRGEFCLDAMPSRTARVFGRTRVGDLCYVLSSDRVVASVGGTSCAIDRTECALVELSETEVGCPHPTPWRGDARKDAPIAAEPLEPAEPTRSKARAAKAPTGGKRRAPEPARARAPSEVEPEGAGHPAASERADGQVREQ